MDLYIYLICFYWEPRVQITKIYLSTQYIIIELDPQMSHFYLYPLLLSQGYSSFQIQQILHSYGLFSHQPLHTYPISPFLSLGQNFISRPSYSRNLILQQDNPTLSLQNHLNQNHNLQQAQNSISQNHEIIKEQHAESQDKTSQRVHSKKLKKTESDQKNCKKKRIAKMSLKQKREKQLKRNQTENSKRNVIPNEIHQMLSILFKKKKSCNLVQTLIQKYSALHNTNSLSVQRFYLYHSLLKEKINHYANEQSLKILLEPLQPSFLIYSREQQILYGKIGLTLINYFLNNEATLVILNSKRIKVENKYQHLKTKRYLAQVLNQIISSNQTNQSS